MTIFVLHAPQDLEVAEGLEKFLERRGHFAELQDGEMALRPVSRHDVVVALVSKDFVFSPWRLRFEQRALEAWAENRLVIVKLDHNFAPIGLRDLPFIDASFEAQRDPFTWQEVEKAIREKLRPAPPSGDEQTQSQSQEEAGAPGAPAPQPAPRVERRREAPVSSKRKSGGPWGFLLGLLLLLPGLGAAWVAGSIWLVNRIGPTPGTISDLLSGIDDFGVRYGAPSGITVPVFGAAMALSGLVLIAALAGALIKAPRRRVEDHEDFEAPPAPPKPKKAEAPAAAAPAEPEPAVSDAVFVSYARVNSALVMPVIEGAKEQGRKFWLDTENMDAGDSWAGEIVRAIRTAGGVCVMCSKAAFESDHVKREVYLADRYKRRLVPVFIEEVAPPEDFEYFFAGVQWLKLHETPEAERPAALVRALGTA